MNSIINMGLSFRKTGWNTWWKYLLKYLPMCHMYCYYWQKACHHTGINTWITNDPLTPHSPVVLCSPPQGLHCQCGLVSVNSLKTSRWWRPDRCNRKLRCTLPPNRESTKLCSTLPTICPRTTSLSEGFSLHKSSRWSRWRGQKECI